MEFRIGETGLVILALSSTVEVESSESRGPDVVLSWPELGDVAVAAGGSCWIVIAADEIFGDVR